MFVIRKITDDRTAVRVCASFGVDEPGGIAYGAFSDKGVLATAAFLTEQGGCVVLRGVDTGRRLDVGLVDGMARTAFMTQQRAGAKTARLSEELSDELRQALSKLGYAYSGPFSLKAFFEKKHCRRPG